MDGIPENIINKSLSVSIEIFKNGQKEGIRDVTVKRKLQTVRKFLTDWFFHVVLLEDGRRRKVSFCLSLTENCFLAESVKSPAEIVKSNFT